MEGISKTWGNMIVWKAFQKLGMQATAEDSAEVSQCSGTFPKHYSDGCRTISCPRVGKIHPHGVDQAIKEGVPRLDCCSCWDGLDRD